MYSSLSLFRKYILFSGITAIVIAALVLTGWQFGIETLKTFIPGVTPMNPVTAITLILSGTWIILFTRQELKYRNVIAVIVSVVGLLHVIGYFVAIDEWRMDSWLYVDVSQNIPPRIPPNTALNFLLCGIAMLLTGKGQKKQQTLRQSLLFFSFLLTYTSLLGYVFDIQTTYRIGGLSPMALITTIAFMFIQVGLIFCDTRYGLIKTFASEFAGGRLMRRIIPLILLIPPLINYLALIGSKKGWYSAEFGTQLSTFIFIMFLLVFISFYGAYINKKHQTEKEHDQKFVFLMESINESILETDAEGIIIYVNVAFEKLLGYHPKEIIGQSALDVIIPEKNRQKFEERLANRRKGIEDSYISELIDKSGQKKQVAITAKPILGNDGNLKSILVSLRDITEDQRQLQDIKAFTDFAAHDLKAPLVNLSMLIEMIKESSLNEEQVSIMKMMNETSNKMMLLVDDLLQFSRMGAAELKKEKVDTWALVNEILSEMDTSKHHIKVGDLPVIEANETACRQLFINMIANAIKYSSKAGKPEVHIYCRRENGAVSFIISDNGIGIDPKFIDQLFQPFKRFTSQFKGNGLGLAIVKRIVEKHGGQIEAFNNETGGMRFEFTLTPGKRMI